MSKVPFTIDWDRSIIIDDVIDDELVKRLTPKILSLRQQSKEPITVGIDSPGGSLESLKVLIGLLTGCDQNGDKSEIYTVVLNKAFSAAGILLSFGDYAISLDHSSVLYHDVRYSKLYDVTSAKARDEARKLQEGNDSYSLELAHKVIPRVLWNYIDLDLPPQNETAWLWKK